MASIILSSLVYANVKSMIDGKSGKEYRQSSWALSGESSVKCANCDRRHANEYRVHRLQRSKPVSLVEQAPLAVAAAARALGPLLLAFSAPIAFSPRLIARAAPSARPPALLLHGDAPLALRAPPAHTPTLRSQSQQTETHN